MSGSVTVVLLVLFGSCSAKELTRLKRQQNMFMCGNYPSSILSLTPCSQLVYSLRSPSTSFHNLFGCNSGCGNINCNQYNGQWTNGQHFFGSNQYNPCASSCCAQNLNFNSYNPYNTGFGPYGPHNYVGIGNGAIPNNDRFYNPYATTAMSNGNPNTFTGRVSNNVLLCGGIEPIGGTCHDGQCPNGHICIAGNICCRCAVGASAGTCTASNGNECPIGYSCTSNGQCCASQVARGMELLSCINNSCNDGFQCGKGNLCYPITSF